MNIDPAKLGWLVGIWDGEGSVGLRRVSPTNIGPNVQMSMTCKVTIDEILRLLTGLGVTSYGYSYAEKRSYHLDAHMIRVNRMVDAALLAHILGPLSITKRRQWELLAEFAAIRLANRRVMPDGRLARGGIPLHPLGEREFQIYDEMRRLNHRNYGPQGETRHDLVRLRGSSGRIGGDAAGAA